MKLYSMTRTFFKKNCYLFVKGTQNMLKNWCVFLWISVYTCIYLCMFVYIRYIHIFICLCIFVYICVYLVAVSMFWVCYEPCTQAASSFVHRVQQHSRTKYNCYNTTNTTTSKYNCPTTQQNKIQRLTIVISLIHIFRLNLWVELLK